MVNILITNNVETTMFSGRSSFTNLCTDYFTDNNWSTLTHLDDWKAIIESAPNQDSPKVVLLWFQQQTDRKHLASKKEILKYLLFMQQKDLTKNLYILDYIEDVHKTKHFFELDYEFYKQNFPIKSNNYIIVRYINQFDKYFKGCNSLYLPFSIPDKFIQPFNAEPDRSLLLTGEVLPRHVYPLRNIILKLMNKYNISRLEHPGYGKLLHDKVGISYFKYINQYFASVSTCGADKFSYLLKKYFEVPSTGALLFAHDGPIKQLLIDCGFIEGEHYVSFNKDNLEERIRYILDSQNWEEIDGIRLAGYNLVKQRHTHRVRFYDEFHKFVIKLV